jgi:Acyclic terpene utilisation family protein AtuA
MIRIASGLGYWGDWPQAAALQVRSGPIDYLVMDYLAEVTMSIMQKQRSRDPARGGFASDFVDDIGSLLPEIVARDVRVVANAGGVNPRGCAEALLATARRHGVDGLRVAVVAGDDILDKVIGDPPLPLVALDVDAPPLDEIRGRLTSANVYMGAFPIADALGRGAQIVITGRCADPALSMGPIIHAFGVAPDDHDALAFGAVVGHLLECGAQGSGGNFMGDWRSVPDMVRIGFPIAEVVGVDRAVITKHASLGGLVTQAVLKEQLCYEIGDPTRYLTPDVTADFTTIQLTDAGPDRVAVGGVRGTPPPSTLKVSCVYSAGWMLTGQLTYSWPDAYAKACEGGRLLRARVEQRVGTVFDEWRIEAVGANACHGPLAERPEAAEEVTLRVSVRGQDRAAVDYVGREFAPLVLTGPPGATGFAGGRPRAREVAAYWAGAVARDRVTPTVEVIEG